MTLVTPRLALGALFALGTLAATTGCGTMHRSWGGSDCRCESNDCRAACPNGTCRPGGGNCPQCSNGSGGNSPRRWSDEWYAERERPIAAPQKTHAGKLWPPYPRPCGDDPECSHIFHAAHYWPYPYVCDDRAYVQQALAAQEQNGWNEATTLYEYHFHPETQELNQPGHLHLKWILNSPRPEYGAAFVQTGDVPAVTDARIANVRAAAIELVGEENLPPILPRIADPIGWSARKQDSLQRRIYDHMPNPYIQYMALPSGSGGGTGP